MELVPAIALTCSILTCFLTAVSLILQKKAHKQSENSNASTVKNKYWIAGFVTLIISSVINLLTLPFIDMVILSTLSSVTLMFNSILAIMMLGEKFTKHDLASFVLISAGVVGCCLLANGEVIEYSTQELYDILSSGQSLSLMIIIYCFIAGSYIFYQIIEKKLQTFYNEALNSMMVDSDVENVSIDARSVNSLTSSTAHDLPAQRIDLSYEEEIKNSFQRPREDSEVCQVRPSSFQLIETVVDNDNEVITKVAPSSSSLKYYVRAPLFLIGWSAGMLSGMNTLSFKIVGEMIKSEADGNGPNVYSQFPFYIFIFLGVFGAVFQLMFLNLAMKNYNQMEVMPVYQSSIIVNTLLAGLFILSESRFYSTARVIYINLCCFICVVGIWVIMKKPQKLQKCQNPQNQQQSQENDLNSVTDIVDKNQNKKPFLCGDKNTTSGLCSQGIEKLFSEIEKIRDQCLKAAKNEQQAAVGTDEDNNSIQFGSLSNSSDTLLQD